MKRLRQDEKICASCKFPLFLDCFYEGRNVCVECQRAKELKQLGSKLHVQPYLDGWKR